MLNNEQPLSATFISSSISDGNKASSEDARSPTDIREVAMGEFRDEISSPAERGHEIVSRLRWSRIQPSSPSKQTPGWARDKLRLDRGRLQVSVVIAMPSPTSSRRSSRVSTPSCGSKDLESSLSTCNDYEKRLFDLVLGITDESFIGKNSYSPVSDSPSAHRSML